MSAGDTPGSGLPVVPPVLVGPGAASRALRPVDSAPLAPIADGSENALDLNALLRALQRRWKSAFLLGLLAAVTAGALTFFLLPEPNYTAVALLRVMEETPRVVFPTQEVQTKFEVFQKTQKALVTSRMVLDNVAKDPKVRSLKTVRLITEKQEDPVEWLEKQIKVDFPPGSEILQISLSGTIPTDLQGIVNAVTDTYIRLVVDEAHSERIARLESLRRLWDDYQVSMKKKREDLRRLAVAAGSDDKKTLAMRSQLAHQQLAMIQQEKLKVKSELIRLKAEAAARSQESANDGKTQPTVQPIRKPWEDRDFVEQLIDRNPQVDHLREKLHTLVQRHENIRRIAKKGNDPSLTGARKQIEDATLELESLRTEVRSQIVQELKTGRAATGTTPAAAAAADPLRLNEQIAILEQFQKELDKEALVLEEEAKDINENTLDLETEKEEITLLDTTAKRVGTEVEVMEVELKAPKRVKVIDRAKVPQMKDHKKQVQATLFAMVAAMGCTLFGVSFWEVRARRINSTDQVVRNLGLRVVGSLPALPTQAGGRRALRGPRNSHHDWQKLLVESVDATRATLLYASRVQGLRTVMVTSAQASEGKTSLASHLAASLARAGRKTLLIDCDFRRPAIYKLFDLAANAGVAEALRGEVSLAEILYPSPANNLTITPAGRVDPIAMEALGRGDLQTLLDDLKSQFDFIILDSAPVLPVADSLLISQHVDAVLLSILNDVSRVPDVQATYQKLLSLGVQVLGAVVAGATDQGRYGSSSYYYYSESKSDSAEDKPEA